MLKNWVNKSKNELYWPDDFTLQASRNNQNVDLTKPGPTWISYKIVDTYLTTCTDAEGKAMIASLPSPSDYEDGINEINNEEENTKCLFLFLFQ